MKEVERGWVIGPFELDALSRAHVNSFSIITYNHWPYEWIRIMDLSLPAGVSVNEGILAEPEWWMLHCMSVDEPMKLMQLLGWGSSPAAKLGIKSGYQINPVCWTDSLLLGIVWKENIYVNLALLLGLCLAPQIFNSLTCTFQWILVSMGIYVIHYLDNLLLFRPSASIDVHWHLGWQYLCLQGREFPLHITRQRA